MRRVGVVETIFGPTGERISFDRETTTFYGHPDTDLWMIIRLPTGALRIRWIGDELIVDDRYLMTCCELVTWRLQPDVPEERTAPYYIELFGHRSEHFHIHHGVNVYVIRCERDYPATVMLVEQYNAVSLTILRDHRISQLRNTARLRQRDGQRQQTTSENESSRASTPTQANRRRSRSTSVETVDDTDDSLI